ncbi:MAG TPA: DUF5682 family protein [Methylomirabilota bacterium]|nr:DUF5682 family protein [Methylomirabilota bacterium]
MPEARTHIFGIRHHGPGSARSLVHALADLQPDCILIEGPPDADDLLELAADAAMKPPVALLIYDPERPQRASFYPFADFSPEWQAIQFGFAHKIPVRFMDLPQSFQMGVAADGEGEPPADEQLTPESQNTEAQSPPSEPAIVADPLAPLALAAGFSDPERWWEKMVEHRRDSSAIFPAIMEAMAALREQAAPPRDLQRENCREAYMRQTIRAAGKEGFAKIAIVCGAWHAPALQAMPSAKDDAALLKGLPKRKVAATWIPWTYSRLSTASGYGAGIESPGWYDFLWNSTDNSMLATRWLTGVARLLRSEDLDASSASVIESVRLAETLAAMRGISLPGLPEMNEATQTTLCFGDPLPLRLVWQKLIVSERLGSTPENTPAVPLAQDLAREQKRLRLKPEASARELDLDLRKPGDLDRSHLLHRLQLLGINWGEREELRGNQKGTFHELWSLAWEPEYSVNIIEAAVWGNTVEDAASAKARHAAETATELQTLTELLDSTLLADLPGAAPLLIEKLQAIAAVATDVGRLIDALPPLANILRYGNVRKTDADMVSHVVDGLVARICIGLPGAAGGLSEEAAEELFERILNVHSAIGLLQNPEHSTAWNAVLLQLADGQNQHGLIAGRAVRLLLDGKQLQGSDAARRLSRALSLATAPAQAAAWVDGFLRSSGLLLLHDQALWVVLDEWVNSLNSEHFTATLPLLRRTFSSFQHGERRQLGVRVASGNASPTSNVQSEGFFDEARANKALPLVAQLLGLEPPSL